MRGTEETNTDVAEDVQTSKKDFDLFSDIGWQGDMSEKKEKKRASNSKERGARKEEKKPKTGRTNSRRRKEVSFN